MILSVSITVNAEIHFRTNYSYKVAKRVWKEIIIVLHGGNIDG